MESEYPGIILSYNKESSQNSLDCNKDIDRLKYIFVFFIALFFFIMLILPASYQLPRGIYLAILTLAALAAAVKYWRCDQDIVAIWLFTLITGLFFIIEGIINYAPGALRVTTIYIIWPCVYILFIGLVHEVKPILILLKTLVVGIFFSCVFNLLLLIGAIAGYKAEIVKLLQFQGAGIGLYDDYIELTAYNLTTCIYGLPFLGALLLLSKNKLTQKIASSTTILVVLIFDLIVCIVSGRRAFWLIALISPFIIYLLFFISGQQLKFKNLLKALIISGSLFFLVILFLKMDLKALGQLFISAFDLYDTGVVSVRHEQFWDLLYFWTQHPLLGYGLGASIGHLIRSNAMTWTYELSYMSLLFHTGIIGTTIYTLSVLWIFFAGIQTTKRYPESSVIILPLLCGLAGFLIINATNPYLGKFDYLWTIFLPVAAINAYRTNNATH